MSLTKRREAFMPFEYSQAYEFWELQQSAHWLHSEISMARDLQDWKEKLSEAEKNVVGNILKGFTQTETVVNDYWSRRVTKWFPKHEIVMMAIGFANMETIHAKAYNYLNESLGLEDYEAFLSDLPTKAKLDNLVSQKGNTKKDIARSLAIFSAFTEGVNLFSSFAILMNFSRKEAGSKLAGVGEIVEFSVRDESLHSKAGCWLFRTFIEENSEIFDDELKGEIYEAARLTIDLEDKYIDKVFELGPIPGLDPKDLKNFIRHRANQKLKELGLKANWKNIDQDSLLRMSWFDTLTGGERHNDFFAKRVTDYSKGNVNWDLMFEGE
jgi:ribonucleoside-diphosphate reductase beta chain